jgi:hypothetical protein
MNKGILYSGVLILPKYKVEGSKFCKVEARGYGLLVECVWWSGGTLLQ